MTIKKTLWRPDVCKCHIEYVWDDNEPDGKRDHKVTAINACPDHAILMPKSKKKSSFSMKNAKQVYDIIIEECMRKTSIREFIILDIGIPTKEYIDSNAITQSAQNQDTFTFNNRKTIDDVYRWKFVKSKSKSKKKLERVLQINGSELSGEQKSAIQAFADRNIGKGKVLVVG